MRERRRKYTAEFEGEAAKMVVENGRPIAEIVREVYVNPGTLGSEISSRPRWRGATAVDH